MNPNFIRPRRAAHGQNAVPQRGAGKQQARFQSFDRCRRAAGRLVWNARAAAAVHGCSLANQMRKLGEVDERLFEQVISSVGGDRTPDSPSASIRKTLGFTARAGRSNNTTWRAYYST